MTDEPRFKMAEDGERFRVLSAAYFFAALTVALVLTLLVWLATFAYLAYIDSLDLLEYLPGAWALSSIGLLAVVAACFSRRAFLRARRMENGAEDVARDEAAATDGSEPRRIGDVVDE